MDIKVRERRWDRPPTAHHDGEASVFGKLTLRLAVQTASDRVTVRVRHAAAWAIGRSPPVVLPQRACDPLEDTGWYLVATSAEARFADMALAPSILADRFSSLRRRKRTPR